MRNVSRLFNAFALRQTFYFLERSKTTSERLAVNAGLGLQRHFHLFPAALRSDPCVTTSGRDIAIPGGGPADFIPPGGVDPTLHFGVVGASESLDKTWSDLPSPMACFANVRPAIPADVNDPFLENSLSRYLVPELCIDEDFDIGQHTALRLDEHLLRIMLAGASVTCRPAQPDLNVLDFLTGEIADGVEFVVHRISDHHLIRKFFSRSGISMGAVEHQKLPQFAGLD